MLMKDWKPEDSELERLVRYAAGVLSSREKHALPVTDRDRVYRAFVWLAGEVRRWKRNAIHRARAVAELEGELERLRTGLSVAMGEPPRPTRQGYVAPTDTELIARASELGAEELRRTRYREEAPE